jgi:hypothetical protein
MVQACKKPGDEPSRRIHMLIPEQTCIFLDLMSRYSDQQKNYLYKLIWNAGMSAIFGVSQEEIELDGIEVSTIPPGEDYDRADLRAIATLMCGEGE